MKAALKWLVSGVVAVPVMLAAAAFLWGFLTAPKPVPGTQIHGLLACVMTNTCKVARTRIQVNGREYWSVGIAYRQTEVQYLTHDGSLKILLTVKGRPLLLEDPENLGIVTRFAEIDAEGKPRVFEAGDPRFDRLFFQLQEMYYESMGLANEQIIPVDISDKKPEMLKV